ncbi:MAG: glycosyltransferase family 39 protein, partial [Prevotella sp.]|nr:glycosyltransferase family 39 protein [Prevotella sp.]
MLYGRILSGNDWLMTLVQWFAFLGTIICISKIAAHLGLNEKMQRVAAVFFATLPMAILQASSTQNDLVETFWIVCLAERLLAWNKEGNARYSLEFGLALGLAILTKGTAYPIAFPLVLFFAVKSVVHYKKRLAWSICAAAVCLALNMPHYIRNYNYFGNPIEANSATVSSFTINSFFVSSFSNIYSNIPAPLPKSLELKEELNTFGKEIYPYGSPEIYSLKNWKDSDYGGIISFYEDKAVNTIHFLLLASSIIFLVSNKKAKKKYALIVLASWAMFFFCIPWQPW